MSSNYEANRQHPTGNHPNYQRGGQEPTQGYGQPQQNYSKPYGSKGHPKQGYQQQGYPQQGYAPQGSQQQVYPQQPNQRPRPNQYPQQHRQEPRILQAPKNQSAWDDDNSESSGTMNEDGPETRAGPAGPKVNPNVPARSYALIEDKGVRTNLGNTSIVMAILSEMWILNLICLTGGTYAFTFLLPTAYTNYTDAQLWNVSCWWKLGKCTCVAFTSHIFINQLEHLLTNSLDFTSAVYFDLFLGACHAIQNPKVLVR